MTSLGMVIVCSISIALVLLAFFIVNRREKQRKQYYKVWIDHMRKSGTHEAEIMRLTGLYYLSVEED